MAGPLDGFRLVDVCRAGPGRLATGILADYGADVITIVEPGYPQRLRTGDAARPEQAMVNRRNKRSLLLNLRAEGALDIFFKLVKTSDALLESNRPGVVKRLGIDYEAVRNVNASIVYCALSGFGQYGPYSGIPAHDLSFQGVAGLVPLDEQGGPCIPPYNQADLNAAWFAAMALMMGLLSRSRTGQGQYVDVAFCDAAVMVPPGRMEDEMLRGHYPAYNIYQTKDGRYVALSIQEPWFWERLCKLLGREEWIPHLRPQGRLREEMFAFFRRTFEERTLAEWVATLQQHDIEFGPVNRTLDELRGDPHVQAREMVLEVTDPLTGSKRYEPGFPLKFARTPARYWRGPTVLGSDTDAILVELGYRGMEIAAFREEGVIG